MCAFLCYHTPVARFAAARVVLVISPLLSPASAVCVSVSILTKARPATMCAPSAPR
jgi:hypothetical protein